jgi:hypothetical protein
MHSAARVQGRIAARSLSCAIGNAIVVLTLSSSFLVGKTESEALVPQIRARSLGANLGGGEKSPKRVVDASEIKRRARNGSPVREDGAVIRGRLNLSYMVIKDQVLLTHCEFLEEPDFSYATFKRHLALDGSKFRQGANFKSMTVDLDARFANTTFLAGKVQFKDLQVHGVLIMHDANFADGVNFEAANAHFERGANFSKSFFGGDVDLYGVEAHSDLFFEDATFQGLFVLGTAKITGSLFLRSSKFGGAARLPGIQVAQNVKAEQAVFKNNANFSESQISSFLDLSGATFESPDATANFARATIAMGGFFDRVRFNGGAKFTGAHFNADASFDQAVFDHKVSFDRAHFDQAAHFEHCVFKQDVSFHETSFGTLDFSKTGLVQGNPQFGGNVDLQGCTYNRIEVHWPSLLKKPDGQARLVVDKQPYLQLQKAFESAGDDTEANQVFLEWHRVKRQEIFRTSKARWLIDCVPWLTSSYGVAPGRLVEISALLLLFGMLIFSCPGAVRDCLSKEGMPPKPRAETIRLGHWNAAAVSLHQFLPIEVPFGSEWTPVDEPVTLRIRDRNRGRVVLRMRPSTCATVLKISGYILVPLEIVLLNTLLKPGL